ncbi:hypothetical protein JCM10207_004643 [Rhodosporidiobolus poonsookiae]
MTVKPVATAVLPPDASTADKLQHLSHLKRGVIGTQAAKEGVLKSGQAASLVTLLHTSPTPPSDDSLAVSGEAANVLAALSLPNLTAVSILLSSNVHQAVVLSVSCVLQALHTSPNTPTTTQHKILESHLRALRALYVDLVKVVGPREWGTEVVGASIDVAEREDAEGLWAPPKKPEVDKGKGKEGDVAMRGVEGGGGVDVVELRRQAQAALNFVFSWSVSPAPDASAGSSSAAASSSFTSILPPLVELLTECASSDVASSPGLSQRMRTADLICSFLAGTVRTQQQRLVVLGFEQGKAVLGALKSLTEVGTDKVRESALKAITVIIRDLPDAMLTLLHLCSGENYTARLVPFTSLTLSPTPAVRLAAATLCAVIAKLIYPPPTLRIPEAELGTPTTSVLLGIIEKEPLLRARAAFAFAYLVADEPELQKRAIGARAFQIFHDVLAQPLLLDQPYPTPAALEDDARVREGILLSLASLSALSETHRRLVLDASLLPAILSALSHPVVGVRAAGCHCVRALSRSVNVLRTDLVESHAESPLVRLLREDENDVVKITASAAVANLLLEFSPMRTVLVEAGCIPRMCQLAIKSPNATLRLNAMWAIKNATYQSSAEFKRSVLQHLTWADLASLLASPSPLIAEQALGILRNITCVTNNEAVTGLAPGEMGEEVLLGLLEERVAAGMVAAPVGGGEEMVLQALYCVNNIATANEAAQLAIASRTTLLRYVLSYLDSRSLPLRVAALWVLHNLIYRRGASFSLSAPPPPLPHTHAHSTSPRGGGSGAPRRPHEIVDKLRALGLEGKLRMLERDPELDVRERVRDLREAMA